MGFGNTRPSLAKLIMTRGSRKADAPEIETEKDAKPLSSTQKLNVDASSEEKMTVEVPQHAENKNDDVSELLQLSIDPTYNASELSPDLTATPPSPKGEQQCFFAESSRGLPPSMENNMLKGLLSLIGKTNENVDRDNSNVQHGNYRKSFFSKHLSNSSTSSFSPRKARKDTKCDERTYLMLENAIAEDWSERQLAFDLGSVTEDNAPIWMISPDEDDEDVTLSAPPFDNEGRFDDSQYGESSSRRRSHRSFRRSFDRFSPRLSTVFELPSEDDSCCEGCHQSLGADTSFTSVDEGSSCYEEECGI